VKLEGAAGAARSKACAWLLKKSFRNFAEIRARYTYGPSLKSHSRDVDRAARQNPSSCRRSTCIPTKLPARFESLIWVFPINFDMYRDASQWWISV
jgi:hypothetical protein